MSCNTQPIKAWDSGIRRGLIPCEDYTVDASGVITTIDFSNAIEFNAKDTLINNHDGTLTLNKTEEFVGGQKKPRQFIDAVGAGVRTASYKTNLKTDFGKFLYELRKDFQKGDTNNEITKYAYYVEFDPSLIDDGETDNLWVNNVVIEMGNDPFEGNPGEDLMGDLIITDDGDGVVGFDPTP